MSIEKQSMEAYLLGMAMAALWNVQGRLIQGDAKEALSTVNEAVRTLNEKVEKHFYSHLKKDEAQNESEF